MSKTISKPNEITDSATHRKPNESLDDLMRRFKRDVSKSGKLPEVKKRQFYQKPSDIRKQKRLDAKKKMN